jgi:hypothetical protein
MLGGESKAGRGKTGGVRAWHERASSFAFLGCVGGVEFIYTSKHMKKDSREICGEKWVEKTSVMTKGNPTSWKARSWADFSQILP